MLNAFGCRTPPAVWLRGGKTVCSFCCDEVSPKFIVSLWCRGKPNPFFFQSSLCAISLFVHRIMQSNWPFSDNPLKWGRTNRRGSRLSSISVDWAAEVRVSRSHPSPHLMLHLHPLMPNTLATNTDPQHVTAVDLPQGGKRSSTIKAHHCLNSWLVQI